jgi:hypothetical protein
MEFSKKTKSTLLISVLVVFILGVTISGPKFINKLQMQFGFKGKIDLIEKCLATSGCAITTDELDLYHNYKKLELNKIVKKLKDSKAGKALEKEFQKSIE